MAKAKNTKTQAELKKESTEGAKKIVSGERVEWKPSKAYAMIYPDGFTTTYNTIIINLIFDGRTYNFTQDMIDFLEDKLERSAEFEQDKLRRFKSSLDEVLGKIRN